MTVATDYAWSIDFTDALDAFKFDETDRTRNNYHGAPMKGVDILVELQSAYLFVEIKEFPDTEIHNILLNLTGADQREKYKFLKPYLKYKFRDTLLYRFAENKVDKPIHYLCLLNLDSALNSQISKDLKAELPVGIGNRMRWMMELAASCQVLNKNEWNRNFPKWPIV